MQSAVGLLKCGKPREETKSPMPRVNVGPLCSVAMPRSHRPPWQTSLWSAADRAAPPQGEQARLTMGNGKTAHKLQTPGGWCGWVRKAFPAQGAQDGVSQRHGAF